MPKWLWNWHRKKKQKNPGNYNGLYSIIVNLLADGRFNEAVPYIENLQKNKDDYQVIVYLGDVALGQGDREKAIQLWNQAVEKSKHMAGLLRTGRSAKEAGDV